MMESERGRWPGALLLILEHSQEVSPSISPLSFAPRAHVHAHEGAAAIKPSQRGAQIERERTRRRVNATPEDGEEGGGGPHKQPWK